MKASRFGFLSIALLVVGLTACPGTGPRPPVVPPPGGTPTGGTPTGGTPTGGITPGPVVPPVDQPPSGPPTGTFGVSESVDGTFTNDAGENITSNDDARIISVAAGDDFYVQINYAAAAGATIESADVVLVNSEPAGLAGTLTQGTEVSGFTLGEPTTACETGGATFTCVYPVTVGTDVLDIEEVDGSGDEFAYVFRVEVTDSEGTEAGISNRGYVNIE